MVKSPGRRLADDDPIWVIVGLNTLTQIGRNVGRHAANMSVPSYMII